LITDISMPDISGPDLLAHAKRHDPGCKVILITGRSDREYLAQALILGAYYYSAAYAGTAASDELSVVSYQLLPAARQVQQKKQRTSGCG